MKTVSRQAIDDEDRLVTELRQLGVTYLSNRPTAAPLQPRPPAHLLADILCQPGSRVRTAIIALLLLHPGYADFVPAALGLLNEKQRPLLKLFYTAAVHLQRLYPAELRSVMGPEWKEMPDLFGRELGIPAPLAPLDAIQQLGVRHQEITHSMTNWAGTYQNVAHHLIRYKQREMQWNQLAHSPSKNF